LTIGITYTDSRYENYPLWIRDNDLTITVIQLTPGNPGYLAKCDGIVLTGGVDTHPRFYRNEKLDYPNAPKEFNEERDEFELMVFGYALEKKLPVLAICRGMQLVNIALGGNLIQDIEDAGKNDHRRHGDTDGMHQIRVRENSLLFEIVGKDTGVINSAHHQAMGIIAPDLEVNAWSEDTIAEGAEWKNKTGKPFLLCVQWHPERLAKTQPENPFVNKIRIKFLEAIKNYSR
jgi:putative glutamine amidotransferase